MSHFRASCSLLSFFLSLLVLFSACTSSESSPPPTAGQKEWTPLFNGKNLNGWTPKITGQTAGINKGNTFRVEDGKLTVGYDAYDQFDGQFGHLVSDTTFSHYVVAVEYRFLDGQAPGGPGWATENSGVMVHSQSAETMTRHQDFPISIEVQLLGSAGQSQRSTANLCTPGTHVLMSDTLTTTHCINSDSKTYPGSEWVRVETLVLGDSLLQHRVNGTQVLEYTNPQIGGGSVAHPDSSIKQDGTPLTSGHIAVQSESHPVQFRTVEVLNLRGCMDPEAANYKSYYVASAPERCTYE
ncbi:hypothetical protein BSZ35_00550 [Salinibacter sp. 10B]|uniref:3-keto-disaccharide hydrolase n=1 Tax=Salinibacter sp. 10B TaxID=1923971 RepID=UPI000CF57472|nr:DUF1080 domain-containing protein [Salinibacter sp. 10B]PQJ33287.1 hypothetical protein BSZ35_00550 [Salinibacter sp. 10B]